LTLSSRVGLAFSIYSREALKVVRSSIIISSRLDYGYERQGFLPCKEIGPQYFKQGSKDDQADAPDPQTQLSIGQKILVQVQKEERGTKGASLTTYISLPGLYLVLIAKPRSAGGVSRRVSSDERSELRELLNQLTLPKDLGVIARTASLGQTVDTLQADLDTLVEKLHAIQQAAEESSKSQLIHKENGLVTLALRNHLTSLDEIIIDDLTTFNASREYIEKARPTLLDKVKFYEDPVAPLFVKFQIDTEALVSIDVNSARATRGKDIEETALNTNLEAAEEIARQLRLRDVGGLIVIDFIDMTPTKNLRAVEDHLRSAVRADRARVQLGRISSRFGLLEMSRQRLHSSLGASNQSTCPRCSGRGTIQKAETLALSLLRILEEDACKEPLLQLQAQLPVEVATFILNEKRQTLQDIEKRQSVSILIIPNPHLTTPHYQIQKVRREESVVKGGSHRLVETPDVEIDARLLRLDESPSTPAITPQLSIAAASYRQKRKARTKKGLLRRIFDAWFSRRKKQRQVSASRTRRPSHHRHRSSAASGSRRRSSQPRGGRRDGGQRSQSSRGGRGGSSQRGRQHTRRRHDGGGRSSSSSSSGSDSTSTTPRANKPSEPKE